MASAPVVPPSLLDLPEEVYGLIYERISCADTKRAFRHTHSSIYRSRFINDHLSSASVSGTVHFLPCISAFPPCATLRRLVLRSCGDEVEACLSPLTMPTDQSRAARWRLSSVSQLRLEGHFLGERSGALLSCCFPRLRDGCEGAGLELVGCEASAVALGSALEMIKLQHLIFGHITELEDEFPQLGHATSLKHLEVRYRLHSQCTVTPLESLKNLVVLKLLGMQPWGLGEVVSALPALEVLSIDLNSVQEAGERLSSSTVKQLHVPVVSLDTSPILGFRDSGEWGERWPALEVLVIGGLDFCLGSQDDAFEKLERMVAWLSRLPLRVASFPRNYGPLDQIHAFKLVNLAQSIEVGASLRAIAPLKSTLSEVTSLFVQAVDVLFDNRDCISALAELFPNVHELILCGNLQEMSLSECLLTFMRGMPRLHKVGALLLGPGIDEVSDMLAPLMEAQMMSQHFQLDVWVPHQGYTLYDSLKAVANQWDASTRLLARGPPVKMTVHLY